MHGNTFENQYLSKMQRTIDSKGKSVIERRSIGRHPRNNIQARNAWLKTKHIGGCCACEMNKKCNIEREHHVPTEMSICCCRPCCVGIFGERGYRFYQFSRWFQMNANQNDKYQSHEMAEKSCRMNWISLYRLVNVAICRLYLIFISTHYHSHLRRGVWCWLYVQCGNKRVKRWIN